MQRVDKENEWGKVSKKNRNTAQTTHLVLFGPFFVVYFVDYNYICYNY